MSSLLAFHAHPDDESVATGVTLAKYADEGHDVVVVTATDGSEGEILNHENPEELFPKLAEIRRKELEESLKALGVLTYEWLGYKDSGMMGTEPNNNPDSFWRQDYFGPVGKLIDCIRKYKPEALITYDPFGGYGHPDHIQTHRVGTAAFFAAGDEDKFPLKEGQEPWVPERLYFSSWSKKKVKARREWMLKEGLISEEDFTTYSAIGSVHEDIDVEIDGTKYVQNKIDAWKAHKTQFSHDWWGFNIPDEYKEEFLGVESYILAFNRGKFNSKSELL